MLEFYNGKRVFVTGHTGFKGSWLCHTLALAGAEVTGYSLAPDGEINLFSLSGLDNCIHSVIGDIRDYSLLNAVVTKAKPEIVFHLAAQPLVLESYARPHYTYEVNVMGTVNLLECLRHQENVRSILNVTTDKVYLNDEAARPFKEDDPLDGYDPYSNSKSCSELVTHSYIRSYFSTPETAALSTARAGNVIGGGDFAENRIVPDCVRAALAGQAVQVRNPNSVRPYQHVLDPLCAYLAIAEKQYKNAAFAGSYNVGPEDADCVTTGTLATLFCNAWGESLHWEAQQKDAPHEANYLKLDCRRIHERLGWKPRWHVKQAIERTVEWTKLWRDKGDVSAEMERQIRLYFEKSGGGNDV